MNNPETKTYVKTGRPEFDNLLPMVQAFLQKNILDVVVDGKRIRGYRSSDAKAVSSTISPHFRKNFPANGRTGLSMCAYLLKQMWNTGLLKLPFWSGRQPVTIYGYKNFCHIWKKRFSMFSTMPGDGIPGIIW
jgi:hypothetical protein